MWGDDIGPQGFDVDDSASAFLRTESGQTVSLDVAWATNRPTNDEFVLRGTEAGARLDRASHDLTIYEANGAGTDHLTDAEIQTQGGDTHKAELRYFIDHVAAGEPPERNTVEEGLAVQRVIDAIYRSWSRVRPSRWTTTTTPNGTHARQPTPIYKFLLNIYSGCSS